MSNIIQCLLCLFGDANYYETGQIADKLVLCVYFMSIFILYSIQHKIVFCEEQI